MRLIKYAFILALIFLISGCSQGKTESQKAAGQVPAGAPAVTQKQPAAPEPVIPVEPSMPAKTAENPVAGGPITMPPTKITEPQAPASIRGEELIIADFEAWPNNLGGEVGVYGSLEPDWEKINQGPVSWVYEATSLGYNPENVHSGTNSFRLVNGTGLKPEYTWGSFSMDLGPTQDITSIPKKVESLDASEYKYLVFWVKGEKGGEKMELLIRDAHALNYSPQVKYKLPDASREWKKIVVPLSDISGKVDITKLDNIGIAFGSDVGNLTNDTLYVDDFAFTPLENPLP